MITRIQRRQSGTALESVSGASTELLGRIYATRGVKSVTELARGLNGLLPVESLGGATEAAGILADTLTTAGHILVVGDFDADGATSCALSVLALQAMGCQKVNYLVPNRFEYGYGLTPEIVALAAEQKPDLIVTVDNGISSIAGVAAANALSIPVVVTDHHLPGRELPAALAVVNPNMPDNDFQSKALAGVGVMFYVLLALRKLLRERGWFAARNIVEPNMADFLDLVALGTVADVVPLDANNRILVYQGLARIRAGHCRPGITALLRVAGRTPENTVSSDMGFAVGPRLNAAGRLDDMSIGIECLLASADDVATDFAMQLDAMNRQRRSIEEEMKATAMMILDKMDPQQDDQLPWGLCLYDETWHQGVIGILASRIKERYGRPTIVFAPGDDGQIKGSARSIPALHIRDVLDEVATLNPGLLSKFGGHAMAAGMSLDIEKYAAFCDAFDKAVRRILKAEDLNSAILSDGEIPVTDFTMNTAQQIADGGPWGSAFPEPVFDGWFHVQQQRVLKDKHWKLVLKPEMGQRSVDAIGFNLVEPDRAPLPEKIHLAYQLDINEFRGNRSLQLRITHIET